MGSEYNPPEPEYATIREYVKLRNLELDHKTISVLGRRATDYSRRIGAEMTKRRGSPLNPGKMVTGYRVDVLDSLMSE